MKAQINMVGIITSNFDGMRDFYRDVMGFAVLMEMPNYVEFANEGVRFAISTDTVMAEATGDQTYLQPKQGHSLELAFKVDTTAEVDTTYADLVAKGATAVKEPADLPWGQRAAFFADPDGHVHEVFADLN